MMTNRQEPWTDQSASLVAPIERDPGYGPIMGQIRGISSARLAPISAAAQAANARGANRARLRSCLTRKDGTRSALCPPAFLAQQVRAPSSLIHGENDTVAPIDPSRRIESALRAAGKPVRFVALRGDDHHLPDAETRIQTLREMESFLAQHLRAAP